MLFRIANREDPDQTTSLFEILVHLPYHDTESSSLIGTVMEMVKIYLILLLNIFRSEMATQKKDEKVR